MPFFLLTARPDRVACQSDDENLPGCLHPGVGYWAAFVSSTEPAFKTRGLGNKRNHAGSLQGRRIQWIGARGSTGAYPLRARIWARQHGVEHLQRCKHQIRNRVDDEAI